MTKRFAAEWLVVVILPLGCGSVAFKSGSGDQTGPLGVGGDTSPPFHVGDAGDGDAGAGGESGSGDGGGATPGCTGAGICGRGPTGIFCAQSNGASAFTSFAAWTDKFGDADAWKSVPANWATIQFPDINGDGKADVCGRASTGISCGLGTGASAFAAPTIWSATFANSELWNQFPYYWATIQFPDVNGDGKADVCGRGSDGVYCGISTGVDGFGPATNWVAGFSDAGGWATSQTYWGTVQFPDVNGDGKADVCGRGMAGVLCALSNGASAFGAVTLWQNQYNDGAGWNTLPSYSGTLQFPDINGDGKADVCGRSSTGLLCAISNGINGFGPASLWSNDFTNVGSWQTSQSYWGTIQFPDVNGDGKADVCAHGSLGVVCGLSNGTSGFSGSTNWAPALSDAAGFNSDATTWGTIQFPDLDGDGKSDVCGRTSAGIVCGLSNGANGFNTASWLEQFTDINGWRTDLSYGGTLQTANLNVTGCKVVTKRSAFPQPLVRRLAPF